MRSIDTHFHQKANELGEVRIALSKLLAGYRNFNNIPSSSAEALREAYRYVEIAESAFRLERQP